MNKAAVRRRPVLPALAILLLAIAPFRPARAVPRPGRIVIAVAGPAQLRSIPINQNLLLEVRPDPLAEGVASWRILLLDRRHRQRDLLWNSGHGPHSAEFDAWALLPGREQWWSEGARVVLPSHQLYLSWRCRGCAARGKDAQHATFAGGYLEITWRFHRSDQWRRRLPRKAASARPARVWR